ncbi:hydroxyphenylacetyl-CoA thioesterase PaaI [Polycladidibacter stylochi]|uniref:hydroxyphenylacetyl-CoA thioesterase PaaI n=1 Tax=Polycladidibacter stylochi TaxID=1807766 RepID=UPI000831644B|nr:hydroxyphenylacetyl-CoA thioesterase PaaI [Pseudovibrio stylochi]
MALTAQQRAEKSATAMWSSDEASKWLGMKIERVAPGEATLSMTIESHHANGHGICHGGVIFSLADSTFAFACNSYNEQVVGQHANISYLSPGRLGDTLTATAKELSKTGRSGITDVSVCNQDGIKIAEFRGFSRVIKGQHFQE